MLRRPRFYAIFLALMIACLLLAFTVYKRVLGSSAELQSPPLLRNASAAEHKLVLPPCPRSPYPMLKSSAPETGHHKVFLSWNASTSSGVGYCLYRRQKKNQKRTTATTFDCLDCEQVTFLPILASRCVDDLVKDNTTYDYVAIAINASGQTSILSNVATAHIPAAEKRLLPLPFDAASYSACRVPTTSDPSPGP